MYLVLFHCHIFDNIPPKSHHVPIINGTFNPSRFLGPKPELDPRTLVFGFGRRMCPSPFLVNYNTYPAIAQSLAVFRIRKALWDEKEVEIEPSLLKGVVSHLEVFEISVDIRDERYKGLAEDVGGNGSGEGDG
ncbi:hypothetical protein BJX65DRAFT_314654 [Aspergillus insuetus]